LCINPLNFHLFYQKKLSMSKKYLLLCLLLLVGIEAFAQKDYFYKQDELASNIPSPEGFLGYPIGEWHTRYDRLIAYFEKLAEISPNAHLETIGFTHQGRPQVVLYISHPDHIKNLEAIRKKQQQLADPSQPIPEVKNMPAIVNLAYSVHGNEPSTTEASILTAYWLLAAKSSEVEDILNHAVIMIDPAINPDGRDRHTFWVNNHKGNPPVADPLDREHNEIWPSGRVNHYWFDLNRDWLPLAQIELQNKIKWYHTWYPNVVGDFHEMGTNSTYFFEPTKPFGSENPVVPRKNYEDINSKFANYFANALDEIGSLYWTKEVFDNSYPGYGSTYPDIHGGLGLVFEQGSSRGHIQSSQRGDITFAFTIRNQFEISKATIRAAVKEREYMHLYLREFYQTALTEAAKDKTKAYVFGDAKDFSKNRLFLDLLLQHHIQVYENPKELSAKGQNYKIGSSWIVPTQQPQYRMVRSIFEKVTQFADSVFYDASTWTMALAFGIPHAEQAVASLGKRVEQLPSKSPLFPTEKPSVALLVDWSDYFAGKFLNLIQQKGVHVETSTRAFTANTSSGIKEFSTGTLIIPMGFQSLPKDEVIKIVKQVALETQQDIYGVSTGLSLKGIDLGSNQVSAIQKPKVLMLVGQGTSQYEAGEIWHLMDTKLAMLMTKVDLSQFGRVNLFDYNRLILTSGNYETLSPNQIVHIKDWINRGGIIIAIKGASQWLERQGLIKEEYLKSEEKEGINVPFGSRRDFEGAKAIGGSIYLGKLDLSHPLNYGYSHDELPVYRNTSIFFKASKGNSNIPVRYTSNPLLSGYISGDNLEKVKQSISVLVTPNGQGRVISFIDSPNFRGSWIGTNRMFFNALYFGDKM
jgi:hypothetical protein